MNKKKVLFLATRNPYFVNDGRSYTLNSYCKAMQEQYDLKILYFDFTSEMTADNEILSYPSTWRKLWNCFFLSLIQGYPLQTSAMYCRKTKNKIMRVYKEFCPDIIICDMCRTAIFLKGKNITARKILDMDDILSARYLQAYRNKTQNALGQLKNNIPSFLGKLYSVLKIDRRINKFEYRHMKKYEAKCKNQFEKIILVSPLEVERYNKEHQTDKAICWPVCVNPNYETNPSYEDKQICFVGNMNVSHNQETLAVLIHQVLPKLDKSFNLLVIGACSPQIMEKYSGERIKFTGRVENISEYVGKCLCMAAPIQSGSGIKIKILESMAYLVPVITTRIGAEGLQVENGNQLYIAADDNEMAQDILTLSDKPEIRARLTMQAAAYLKTNHSMDTLKKSIEKVLN